MAANVHPTAVIEGDVILGEGATVGPLCYLRGPIVIGAGTQLWPHAIIGTEGEHRTRRPAGTIRIGAGVIIRELVVVQRGTGDRETEIGDGCYIMEHCHVAHDVVIGARVTMSPNVALGGHTHVHEGATVGIGAVTHQLSTVGAYTMIGMGAVVTRDVPPFALVMGNPARYQRLNTHAIEHNGFEEGDFRVEHGVLTTTDARAQALLDRFHAEVRRKVMPLESPGKLRSRAAHLRRRYGPDESVPLPQKAQPAFDLRRPRFDPR